MLGFCTTFTMLKTAETGLYYYGARYYNPQISVWLSVDPLAEKYPSMSSYCFTANNPVMLVDPDGRWIPGLDDDGNVTYTAEKGDTYNTFKEQYGLTEKQASAMLSPNTNVKEGETAITGAQAKKATGNDILKLDWQSNQATDSRRIDQVLFALENENQNQTYDFAVSDYFKNVPYNHKGQSKGFGGAAFLVGSTSKITGKPVKIEMMLNHRSNHRINTISGSDKNFYINSQSKYIFNYTANSRASHPTYEMFIKFSGETVLNAFSKKFGSDYSGVRK